MTETNTPEEKYGIVNHISETNAYGISSTTEKPFVVAGYGETAKREGAKTREVHNVSS
jgi:hypothetical protein